MNTPDNPEQMDPTVQCKWRADWARIEVTLALFLIPDAPGVDVHAVLFRARELIENYLPYESLPEEFDQIVEIYEYSHQISCDLAFSFENADHMRARQAEIVRACQSALLRIFERAGLPVQVRKENDEHYTV